MKRYQSLAAGVTAAIWAFSLPLPAVADVSVVKVINFSCQFCRSSEVMDEPIRRAAEAAGGHLVYATMPADDASDGSRELVYYAARALIPAREPQIRQSLYKGAQDLGYPLATASQATEWLSTDLGDLKYDWASVLATANGPIASEAFRRALRLAVTAGVQVLPSYVVVKDGEVQRTLDVDTSNGSYAALREAVLAAVEKAQAPATKSK